MPIVAWISEMSKLNLVDVHRIWNLLKSKYRVKSFPLIQQELFWQLKQIENNAFRGPVILISNRYVNSYRSPQDSRWSNRCQRLLRSNFANLKSPVPLVGIQVTERFVYSNGCWVSMYSSSITQGKYARSNIGYDLKDQLFSGCLLSQSWYRYTWYSTLQNAGVICLLFIQKSLLTTWTQTPHLQLAE